MFQCHSMVQTFEVKNDDFFIAQFESVDGKLFSQYEFKYSSHWKTTMIISVANCFVGNIILFVPCSNSSQQKV